MEIKLFSKYTEEEMSVIRSKHSNAGLNRPCVRHPLPLEGKQGRFVVDQSLGLSCAHGTGGLGDTA